MSYNRFELIHSSPNWTDKHSLYTLFETDYGIFNEFWNWKGLKQTTQLLQNYRFRLHDWSHACCYDISSPLLILFHISTLTYKATVTQLSSPSSSHKVTLAAIYHSWVLTLDPVSNVNNKNLQQLACDRFSKGNCPSVLKYNFFVIPLSWWLKLEI